MNAGELLSILMVMGTVVLIVAILASAYKRRLAHIERKLELAAQTTAPSPSASELEARLERLETLASPAPLAQDAPLLPPTQSEDVYVPHLAAANT